MERSIAVIDMKAFYASVECHDRGLNPFTTPLAVCDPTRGDGTIVLSVSPYLKTLGYPSVCRRRDLKDVPDLILAMPRMQKYIERSAEILSVALDFVGEDDIHVYSIDEFFVNLGPYLKMYECTPKELTQKIQKAIFDKTGLITTAGVSYNMLLAKVALDCDAKNKPPYISVWTEKDIKNKLWKITPLSKMWGINVGYERKLNNLGITTIGQLANTDKDFMKAQFGVIGEQLWEHANGIDNTDLREKYIPRETSLSIGQVLMRDYSPKEAELIIKEMNDELCIRLRAQKQKTSCISLSVMYTVTEGGGFSHQCKLDFPTDDSEQILEDVYRLYRKYIGNHKVRRISINFSHLSDEQSLQLSLFEEPRDTISRSNLQAVMDTLKLKYGKDIVLRASSLLDESTIRDRHQQIGGHRR